MPRTPPPAPSKDSIRDFAGYFATLSTPRKSHGSGETGPTSALNQSAVSSRTASTDTNDSVDTASPSISDSYSKKRLRCRSLSSTTSATLSVSTTDHTTTTTAEEESRVERELLVKPRSAAPERSGLRVRLRVRQASDGEFETDRSRCPSVAKRPCKDIDNGGGGDDDDEGEYLETSSRHDTSRKKKRSTRSKNVQDRIIDGKRRTRSRDVSTPASRESTASIGSAVPKSSHGRNTRSNTLAADPAQTLETVGAANKALDDRLREIGLRVVNVASDGNCLFRVFAHQLFDDVSRHFELRTAICDYLKTHADTLSCYNWNEHGESYEQYVTRMRKPKVWGGYLELYAFTQLYACRLIIYESDREQVFGEGDDVPENAKVVRLSYHGGVHYNSVVPTEQDGEGDDISSMDIREG
ncbi:hypothetical protein QFC19_006172 [Naganishia cerealis]|uniref:Uncharacterized protein n=1 Tax=Naganishia cerealis TaxID=610337 RepID=A0ACC2VHT7_9TREE|nr:hypothetical protein QFC19_006172 [Naganishia cerealis]